MSAVALWRFTLACQGRAVRWVDEGRSLAVYALTANYRARRIGSTTKSDGGFEVMRKRAEIKTDEWVTWWVKVRPELPYKAGLDAKVLSLDGEMATIAVASDVTAASSVVKFQVLLSELESKTWERDEEAWAKYERERFEKAAIVDPKDCEAVIESDGEKIYHEIEDYLEECEDNEVEPSLYLWCVNLVEPEKLTTDAFTEHWYEQVGEENCSEMKGVEALQQAIDAFYAANAGMKLCETDYTRAVLVKP
jgi:hypothetical protein